MRWTYDAENGEVENKLALVEAQREIAEQLERVADVLEAESLEARIAHADVTAEEIIEDLEGADE